MSTTTSNVFATIQATLSEDAQKAIAFLKGAETSVAAFLSKVASGATILVEDVEAVAEWVGAHISIINSTLATLGTVAAVVAPGNATVAKTLSDLNEAANDVAGLSTALSTGSTAGQPSAVSTAVTAINAVNQLSALASAASQTLTTLASNTAAATAAAAPAASS
jgi:hypothetical protein